MRLLVTFLGLVLSFKPEPVSIDDLNNQAAPDLTDDNVKAFIAKHKAVVLLFHATWCGHCKAIMETFDEVAQQFMDEKSGTRFAKLESTHPIFAAENKVRGYPTIKVFQDGTIAEYKGGRSKDLMVAIIRSLTGPAIKKVDQLPEIGEVPLVVLRGPELTETLEKAASANRTDADFVFVKEPKFRVTMQHRDELMINIDSERLSDELAKHSIPLFGVLNGENYAKYAELEKPVIWVLFDNANGDYLKTVTTYGSDIRKLAAKYSKYAFTYTDTKTFSKAIEAKFGITEFPSLVVQPQINGKAKFILDKPLIVRSQINTAGVEEFLQKIDNGTLIPVLESKPAPPIPADGNGILEVVGTTMKEMLVDTGKSTFFGIFAHWCRHCKELKPVFEQLGRKIRELGLVDLLAVAQMEGTENDSHLPDLDWDSFPALYFFKNGVHQQYNGARDLDSIWQFILESHTPQDELTKRLASKADPKIQGKTGKNDEL